MLMPSPTRRAVYLVELTTAPNDPTPIVTLRRALKNLLRGFGLRCLGVSEKPADGGKTETDEQQKEPTR